MRLIDADALRERMYHYAFETDSDMQKWDSGCWIRYKLFENAIDEAPTVDAIPIDWILNHEKMPKSGKGHDAIMDMIESWRERREDDQSET